MFYSLFLFIESGAQLLTFILLIMIDYIYCAHDSRAHGFHCIHYAHHTRYTNIHMQEKCQDKTADFVGLRAQKGCLIRVKPDKIQFPFYWGRPLHRL